MYLSPEWNGSSSGKVRSSAYGQLAGGAVVARLLVKPAILNRIALLEVRRRSKAWPTTLVLIHMLALPFFVSVPSRAAARAQAQQRTALGSLSTFGQVYVNDAIAPLESTIFSGDTLRTGGAGAATFTLSGKGSFRISPSTQIVFTGDPQYFAELKSGSVVMSSLSGATGINLRAGSSVVVAVTEGEQSTSNIEAASDGSFVVTCQDGSVGVIPLQGGNGLFIQTGQSVSISPQGQLSLGRRPTAAPPPSTPSPAPSPPATQPPKSNKRWIILGVAGAGAAGVTAAIVASHSGGPAISPSAP
jgi:hypothetical protein